MASSLGPNSREATLESPAQGKRSSRNSDGIRRQAEAPSTGFKKAYAEALEEVLSTPGRIPPELVEEIGSRALLENLSAFPLVALHHEVMISHLFSAWNLNDDVLQALSRGNRFLLETLGHLDVAHRDTRGALVELRLLNRKLQEKLDEEAARIGHALHDEAGQLLASVHLALEDVARDLQPRNQVRLRELRKLLDEIENQLRSLAHEIRPVLLGEKGLQQAVEFLAASASTRTGVPVVVHGSIGERLPPTVETAVYRIIQEALTNAIRHARPRRVQVSLHSSGQSVGCRVVDEGSGFASGAPARAARENGIGLIGIRERVRALGGTLRIRSSPGKGTEVRVELPLGG